MLELHSLAEVPGETRVVKSFGSHAGNRWQGIPLAHVPKSIDILIELRKNIFHPLRGLELGEELSEKYLPWWGKK